MKKIAVLIIAIICCFCCAVVVGCGSKDSTPSPSSVVDTALKAIQAGDDAALDEVCVDDIVIAEAALGDIFLVGADDLEESTQQAIDSLMEKILAFDYTIGTETINGDEATVEVNFKTYDIQSVLVQMLGEYAAEVLTIDSNSDASEIAKATADALLGAVDEALATAKEKTVESSATISLEKVDGKWMISSIPGQVLNAMFGGSPEAMAVYQKTLDVANTVSDGLNSLSDTFSGLSESAKDAANAIKDAVQ